MITVKINLKGEEIELSPLNLIVTKKGDTEYEFCIIEKFKNELTLFKTEDFENFRNPGGTCSPDDLEYLNENYGEIIRIEKYTISTEPLFYIISNGEYSPSSASSKLVFSYEEKELYTDNDLPIICDYPNGEILEKRIILRKNGLYISHNLQGKELCHSECIYGLTLLIENNKYINIIKLGGK